MEIIKTSRISIRVGYNNFDKVVKGEVYSRVEEGEDFLVGYVTDEIDGTATLHVLPEYENEKYIEEDFLKLKKEFANISNFWKARESRGIC